jgi:hypothetical protein
MPAPTSKQRRTAKQRDALGWARNSAAYEGAGKGQERVRPHIGAHVYSVGANKLGTVREIFAGDDGMTRARVQHFNGEWWEWNPPLSLLEVI